MNKNDQTETNKRNYKNEIEWRKKKYSRAEVMMEKEILDPFKLWLKNNNRSFADWMREKIAEMNLDEQGKPLD